MAVTISYELSAPLPDEASGATDTIQTPARPVSPVWHSARLGLERGAQWVVAIIGGLSMIEFGTGLGWLADFVIGFLVIGLLYSGLNALVTLLWKLARELVKLAGRLLSRWLPEEKAMAPYRLMNRIRGQSIGAVIAPLAIIMMDKVKIGGASMISQPGVTESLIPFAIVACVLGSVATVATLKPWVRITTAALAVVVLAAPIAWYLWPGTSGYLARPDYEALAGFPEFTFENPAQPGPYAVQTITYGSGQARRPEFGKAAGLITPTVDPSKAYGGWDGMGAAYTGWLFGFDFKHLPLAGDVWYPEGNGPFPLVLIVHGNHMASDYSDPGYAYLGEHFASRGFITVSVDENFLNGHALWDGKGNEMPVRAWMLLKHLQVWREWNDTPGNPFYGKVDLDRVVLMGHSRGGEAVAHAAMLNNRLNAPTSRLSVDGEFGFGIRGVVAIAPADGQWKPMGTDRKVTDVSYLLIQGGHDQDLSSLAGIRQYNRVNFEANPDAFKAVAYIYRANHGNFNTIWADRDHGASASMTLNRAALLAGEEQRTAAKVFMTGFLEATLHDKAEYRKLFVTPAGAAQVAARRYLRDGIPGRQFQGREHARQAGQDGQRGHGRRKGEFLGARAACTTRAPPPRWRSTAELGLPRPVGGGREPDLQPDLAAGVRREFRPEGGRTVGFRARAGRGHAGAGLRDRRVGGCARSRSRAAGEPLWRRGAAYAGQAGEVKAGLAGTGLRFLR